MDTTGIFDQGIRDWVRHQYRRRIDDGASPEQAQRAVERAADRTFGFWRVERKRRKERTDGA